MLWLSVFVWALGENFARVNGLTLVVLGLLALLATFTDLIGCALSALLEIVAHSS